MCRRAGCEMNKKMILYVTIIFLITLTAANYYHIQKAKSIEAEQENTIIEAENLINLSEYETAKLNEFKSSYDDEVLLDLEALSVCKMYLFSGYMGDYETQYEFYTRNEDYVMWSKEEDENIPKEDRMSVKDFEIFYDVYDLNVEYIDRDNWTEAIITWSSKNGHYDENQEAWVYSFRLIKDNEVWKVAFVPMQ